MTKERKTLKADAFLKIEARFGRKKAAELLCISPTNWSPSNSKEGEVTATFELAARYVLAKLDRKKNEPQTIVVCCPADRVELLKTFCLGLDVEYLYVEAAMQR